MAMMFTDGNFDQEVAQAGQPVLVDFYADWCGPCKMMGPVVEEIAKEYEGRAKVGKLNVDDSENTAAKFGVMTIPTLIIFVNGKAVNKYVGVQSKAVLKAALDKALES